GPQDGSARAERKATRGDAPYALLQGLNDLETARRHGESSEARVEAAGGRQGGDARRERRMTDLYFTDFANVPRYSSITFGSFASCFPDAVYALRPWSST